MKAGRITKNRNRWQARATVNGNYVHLGSFKIKEDAIKAAAEFRERRSQIAMQIRAASLEKA